MSDSEEEGRLMKLGGKIGEKGLIVGDKMKKLKKRPAGYNARIGDDITKRGLKKKKGLQIHCVVKVRRATQVYGLNGKEVHVLYSNGKDQPRNRVMSEPVKVKEGIATWGNDAAPYEFDVILRHWDEPVEEDEVPWKNHPLLFSLRTERDMTDKECKELEAKLAKKREKLLRQQERRKKKKKEENDEESDEEDFDENGDAIGEKEIEMLLMKKKKMMIVGTKVQLDLAQYAEHDLNIIEAFGVPMPKKKKEKKKKKGKKALETPPHEEEEEKDDSPPELACKVIVNIQVKFIKYMGRRVSKNLTSGEGERVMIGNEEWVYEEPPLENDDDGEVDEDDPLGIGLTQEQLDSLDPRTREQVLKKVEKKLQEKRKQEEAERKKREKEDKIAMLQQEKETDEMRKKQEKLAAEERKRREKDSEHIEKVEKDHKESERQRKAEEQRLFLQAEEEAEEAAKRISQGDDDDIRLLKNVNKDKSKSSSSSKSSKRDSKSSKSPASSKKSSSSSSKSGSSRNTPTSSLTSSAVTAATSSFNTLDPSRKKVKLTFHLEIKEITGCRDRRNGKMVFIAWRRGSKKENSGETTRSFCAKNTVEFSDHPKINLSCTFTLKKTSNNTVIYDEKNLGFTIREDACAGEKGVFGTATLNLANYVQPGLNLAEVTVPVTSRLKATEEKMVLHLAIRTDGISEQKKSSGGGSGLLRKSSSITSKSLKSLTGMGKHSPSHSSSSSTAAGGESDSQLAKVTFAISIDKAENLKVPEGSLVFVKWERGAKKSNAGSTKPVSYANHQASWPALEGHTPIRLNCTMEKKSSTASGFGAKKMSFHVYYQGTSSSSSGKPHLLGKIVINIADYAKHQSKQSCAFTIQNKSGTCGLLSVTIQSAWTQFAGKRLVDDQEAVQHASADSKIEVDGKEYLLETAEDCSVMSELSGGDVDSDDIKTDFNENPFEADDADDDKSNTDTFASTSAIDDLRAPANTSSPKSEPKIAESKKTSSDTVKSQSSEPAKTESPKPEPVKTESTKEALKSKDSPSRESSSKGSEKTKSKSSKSSSKSSTKSSSSSKSSAAPVATAVAAPSNAQASRSVSESSEDDEDEILRLQKELSEKQTQTELTRASIQFLEHQYQLTEDEMEYLQSGIQEQAHLQHLRQQVSLLQQQLNNEQEKQQDLRQQAQQMNQQNTAILAQKDTLQQKLENATNAIQSAFGQLHSLKTQVQQLEAENQAKEMQIKQFDQKLDVLQQQTIKSLQKSSSSKNSQNLSSVLEEQLNNVKQQDQTYKERAQRANEKLQAIEVESKSLREQIQLNKQILAKCNVENDPFYKRTQFLRRTLLFSPREFEPMSRAPVCVPHLVTYFVQYQNDLDIILELLQMIGMMAKNAGHDHRSILYWLAVIVGLFSNLQQNPASKFKGNVREDGVKSLSHEYDSVECITQATPVQLEAALNLFIYDIYNLVVQQLYDEIDSQLDSSFIRSADLIFEQKVKLSDPSKSVQITINMLEDTLQAYIQNYLPPIFIDQCFSQVIYYISASLFNRIITRPAYCSPRIGLQMKMSCSYLHSWIIKKTASFPVFTQISPYLNYIIDAANILTLCTSEKVFESKEAFTSTFPSLNLAQIRKLLELFTPDKFAPEVIPATVKRCVNNACNQDPRVQDMPLDIPRFLDLNNIHHTYDEENED